MNNKLTKISKRPFVRIFAGALIATLGGILALSVLLAETPTPSPPPRGQCKDWPPCTHGATGNCNEVHEAVKKAFVELMDEASKPTTESNDIRKELVDPENTFKKAHDRVRTKLQSIPIPIPFGNEHQVIFYQQEEPTNIPGSPGTMSKYPNNHCLHVFYLPEVPKPGQTPAPTEFGNHLMCCYQPWKPE